MTLVDVVRRESGIRLHPGLTDADLRQFQRTLPAPLPSDVADLLRFATGFDVPHGEPVDFTGRSHRFELVDVAPDGAWGPVFYACHDPWLVCVAFDTLGEFIEHASPDRLRARANALERSTPRSGS